MNGSLDIIRGNETVGFKSKRTQLPTLPLPEEVPSSDDIIADLQSRLANLETLVEGKADSNKVRTLIAYSDEAVLIKAKDIVLAGDVTIAKVINEQNGTTSGEVPESITRIIGNRVQTGQLLSNNWGASAGSYISLDDGVIIMGGSDDPAFEYSDGDITIAGTLKAGSVIAGTVTVNGVQLSTISSWASSGQSISNALLVSGSSVLKGVLVPTDGGAIKTGTITWNSSTGALTGGTGVAQTEYGIIAASAGTATFTLEAATGNAIFAGDITGASGTFAGAVEGTHLLATGSQTVSGYNNFSIVAAPGDFYAGGVYGVSVSAEAGQFVTSNGTAMDLEVLSAGGSGTGLRITNPTGGYSLFVNSGASRFDGAVSVNASLTSSSISSGAGSFSTVTASSTLKMTSSTANMIIGNATNTGNANLCIKQGAAGARTSGQLQIYGAGSSDGDTTIGFVLDQGVVAGTGPFAGISQLKVLVNATEYWLALNPV